MNVRKLSMSTAVGMAGLLLGSAHAADAPKWYETTKISGFADAYYKMNFNGIKSATANTLDSGFDAHQNTFSVGGGKVELSSMDGVGLVDLYFGDYGSLMQATVGKPEVAVVGQAYIAQPVGPVTVTLGRFFTHIGYEVADSVSNLNFTRGLIYGQEPVYHQGLKLNYSPVDGLGLMAQLDNGNSVDYQTKNEVGGGLQVSYTGIKGLSTYLNYYYSPSVGSDAGTLPFVPWEKTHFVDFVASYGLMDNLTLAGEYLYFSKIAASDTDTAGNAVGTTYPTPVDGKFVPYSPKTQGYALYADYATPMAGLSVSPRFEALYAPDANLSKFDYTLTARYTKGALINWLEFRTDASDDAIYPGAPSNPTNLSYTEMALTWGAGYKF